MSESRQLLTTVIRREAQNGHHSVAAITDLLVDKHKELVRDWINEHSKQMLSDWVSDILRWDRINERKRSPMEEVIERAASGLSLYDLSYPVNDDNLRKQLSEMRGPDHLYVSVSYYNESAILSIYGDLHKHLSTTVGNKLTRTVYTETELRHLFAEYEEKI